MTLCYVKNNGKTLMLKVTKKDSIHTSFWNGLGGKFEHGETPEECVIREVFEESGLKITNPKLKGRITFAEKNFSDLNLNNGHVYVFTADEFTGNLTESIEGKLHWVADSELVNLKVHAGDKIFWPWLHGIKFFSAKFVYDGEELISHYVKFY